MAKEQTPSSGSLYSRLGLKRGATDDQVRTAYYRLAKIFHPDRRKGGERDDETFNSIVRAAAILRNPARRKLYDRGAINEDGVLGRSRGRWPRWSYRGLVLACFVAALTVVVSGVAFYSLDKSGGGFLPEDTQAGRREKTPAAAVSQGASIAHPAAEGKEPGSAPHTDDNPAELLKALQKQQAVYSPPSATTMGHQAEIVSAVSAAAVEDGRDQAVQKNSIILKKPVMAKQKSGILPNFGNIILFSQVQENKRVRRECSLTSAARDILIGIISR
jgi:curved DNA-binding protein CbpA